MGVEKQPDKFPSGQPIVTGNDGKVSSRTIHELKPVKPKPKET